MKTIITRIEERFSKLSPGQKTVAHYIQTHTKDAALLPARELAEQSGVSEATVHRLAVALSYPGYSGMRKELQQFAMDEQRAVRNFTQSVNQPHEESWLEKHFNREIDNLRHTMNGLDKKEIERVARLLLEADRIWVAGWRLGLAVTSSFAYVLKYMLGNCELIPQGGVAEYVTYIGKKDVVFVCGFPRYCARTLKVARMAREQGATVIALTDSALSPFAESADVVLLARNASTNFLDSYTSALSVVHAIVNEISYLERDRVQENIQKMEGALKEFRDSFDWSGR